MYRKFPICIGNLRYMSINKSEISDLVCRFFCSSLQCIFVLRCYKKWFPNGAPQAVWKNIVYFVTLRDKYTLSWNEKAYSKFPTYFANFFVPTYSVFVAKCNKVNNILPNGMCTALFGKKSFLCNISRQIYCKLEQKSLQNKSEICFVSVFCSNFESILSYYWKLIYWKLIYFVVLLETYKRYIYIGNFGLIL